MRHAQADADAVVRESVEAIGRHCMILTEGSGLFAAGSSRLAAEQYAESLSGQSSMAYAAGGLEPSVAQPPLPLQLFLPLQPLSLVLQPPLPLQSFLPLQECLSLSAAKQRWPKRWQRPSCAPLWVDRSVDRSCGTAEQSGYGCAHHHCFERSLHFANLLRSGIAAAYLTYARSATLDSGR